MIVGESAEDDTGSDLEALSPALAPPVEAEDERPATPLYVIESEEPFESPEHAEEDYRPAALEQLPELEAEQDAQPEAEQAQVAVQPAEDPEFVMSPTSSTSSSSDSSAAGVAEKRKQPSRASATSKKPRADSIAVSSRPPRAAKVVGQRMLTASVQSDLRHEKRRSEKKASTDEPAVTSKRARKVFAPAAPSAENAKLNYQFSTLHEVLSIFRWCLISVRNASRRCVKCLSQETLSIPPLRSKSSSTCSRC
jgi:hypothetical protein